jgi:AcrR family transcriptional regulator
VSTTTPTSDDPSVDDGADWHRRVVDRSLRTATRRSIDRGASLVRAAAVLLERSEGEDFTVQDVADEAHQSLRTVYQYFESKDDLLLAVFEEAMRSYATLIGDAIRPLVDPTERLAGALLAAARLPDITGAGANRGLSRLRLRLSQVEPALVGRLQAPVASLVQGLVCDVVAQDGRSDHDDEAATFLLLSLNAAAITSHTLGNDQGTRRPQGSQVARFCLQGLGTTVEPGWLEDVEGRLRLPRRRVSLVVLPTS